ncbi:MAG: hypothetical protein IMY67_11250 [Bacteroidetes bacterium]|nr:hypothetical protein [Bacteroidota bacterium]
MIVKVKKEVTFEFNPNHYLDKADSDSLMMELNERGYSVLEMIEEGELVEEILKTNKVYSVESTPLSVASNVKKLIENIHLINQAELEQFLDKY